MGEFRSILILTLLLSSCGVMKKNSRTDLLDGFYSKQSKEKVYVQSVEDTIIIYPVKNLEISEENELWTMPYNLPQERTINPVDVVQLKSTSLDLDFITIPLKYRTGLAGVKPQLNTEINASIYLGLRTDRYRIGYETNPLKEQIRQMKHFGFSFGIFTGFGNSAITPTTTNDLIAQDYDGVVWTKGLASIFAINNFTLGVAIGMDNLLDSNRRYWIYEAKPWFGFVLGLNIN